jgi:hypothetical protein
MPGTATLVEHQSQNNYGAYHRIASAEGSFIT